MRCSTCKHSNDSYNNEPCASCYLQTLEYNNNWKPKDRCTSFNFMTLSDMEFVLKNIIYKRNDKIIDVGISEVEDGWRISFDFGVADVKS